MQINYFYKDCGTDLIRSGKQKEKPANKIYQKKLTEYYGIERGQYKENFEINK